MATVTMATLTNFAAAGMASRVVAGSRVAVCFPAAGRRRAALVVRAQAEQRVDPTEETAASSPSPSPTLTPAAQSNTKPKAAGGVKLLDVFAFSGPAPERINGRLAMLGFVSALAVEASSGGGILSQAGSGSGMAWFAATAAVFSAASLVPLLSGESAEARSGAFMSANAELWNGRFAMLGLVALALTEYLTGAPFVNI
ncbi:hypothetical protein GUJ93_ZPchr0013g34586 [Zizania palustris]|uniref:Uncharacterized protein n=1 Tax=Zizania palustris TaxID=103762 RepID=A0A8J6C603_ZIZPA|nr:hypothetical protein GUJ93_ZPchr0013g35981 [Zizania palustris]KAG8100513.1 hypothetical protein GUJ93_ZPchr0013g34586 [Zizania palustris]